MTSLDTLEKIGKTITNTEAISITPIPRELWGSENSKVIIFPHNLLSNKLSFLLEGKPIEEELLNKISWNYFSTPDLFLKFWIDITTRVVGVVVDNNEEDVDNYISNIILSQGLSINITLSSWEIDYISKEMLTNVSQKVSIPPVFDVYIDLHNEINEEGGVTFSSKYSKYSYSDPWNLSTTLKINSLLQDDFELGTYNASLDGTYYSTKFDLTIRPSYGAAYIYIGYLEKTTPKSTSEELCRKGSLVFTLTLNILSKWIEQLKQS